MSDDEFKWKVSKFIKKLYYMTCDNSCTDIVWSSTGRSIIITDREQFINHSMRYISKTNEYSAFVRQLYVYGFNKLKTISSFEEEYYHKNFKRDREDLLPYVTRNKDKQLALISKDLSGNAGTSLEGVLHVLNSRNHKLENDVKELQARVTKQECTINGLVELLGRMFIKRSANTTANDTNVSHDCMLEEQTNRGMDNIDISNRDVGILDNNNYNQYDMTSHASHFDLENYFTKRLKDNSVTETEENMERKTDSTRIQNVLYNSDDDKMFYDSDFF